MLGLLTLNLEMVLKFSKKSIGDREVGVRAGRLDGHSPMQRAKLAEVRRYRSQCFHRPEKSKSLYIFSHFYLYIFFETRSHHIGQADLKLQSCPCLLSAGL